MIVLKLIALGFILGVGIYLAEILIDIPLHFVLKRIRRKKKPEPAPKVFTPYLANLNDPTRIKGVEVDPIHGEPIKKEIYGTSPGLEDLKIIKAANKKIAKNRKKKKK